jgi:hypothetical protein
MRAPSGHLGKIIGKIAADIRQAPDDPNYRTVVDDVDAAVRGIIQELKAFGEQAISGDRKENKKVIAALLQATKAWQKACANAVRTNVACLPNIAEAEKNESADIWLVTYMAAFRKCCEALVARPPGEHNLAAVQQQHAANAALRLIRLCGKRSGNGSDETLLGRTAARLHRAVAGSGGDLQRQCKRALYGPLDADMTRYILERKTPA